MSKFPELSKTQRKKSQMLIDTYLDISSLISPYTDLPVFVHSFTPLNEIKSYLSGILWFYAENLRTTSGAKVASSK